MTEEEEKTDWNLVVQGNISLLWIQECLKNKDKTVGELLKEYMEKNENCEILNLGTLIMASYLLLLYPRERELTSIDWDKIRTPEFNFCEGRYKDKSDLVRRIRNSLAHAHFNVDPVITFEDWRQVNSNNQKEDYFKVQFKFCDYGNFINDFFLEVKRQHFEKKQG